MSAAPDALIAHFDRLYTRSDDPWQVATRVYEQRKADLLIACLTHPRYARAYEPGCGTGELTLKLAPRCDHVWAGDASAPAVRIARERTHALPQVRVDLQQLPRDWPAGHAFDLIVISEWAYYLDEPAVRRLAQDCAASLRPGATLLACHSRARFDDRRCETAQVHAAFARALGQPPSVHHEEAEFLIDLWLGPGVRP